MISFLRELTRFIVAIIEMLLVFRFVLKLLGANPSSTFVSWIYDITRPLLQPFLFAFPTSTVAGGFTLEFTTLFAIFAYAFIGYVIEEVLSLLENSSHPNHK